METIRKGRLSALMRRNSIAKTTLTRVFLVKESARICALNNALELLNVVVRIDA